MEDELELGWAFQNDADGSPYLSVDSPAAFIVKMESTTETAQQAEARVRAGTAQRLSQSQVKDVVARPSAKLVTGFTATALSKTAIRLNWKQYGGALYYRVQQSIDNLTWITLPTVTGKTLEVTGLTAATLYHFRVAAVNKQGTVLSNFSLISATTMLGLEAVTGTTTTTPIPALTGIGYNASLDFNVLNLLLSYTEPIEVQVSRGDEIIYGTILGANAGKFNQAGDPWLGYSGRIRLDRSETGKLGIKPGDVITVRTRTVANRAITFVYTATFAAVTSTAAVPFELTTTNAISRLQVFAQVTFSVTTPDAPPAPTTYPPITNRLFVYNLMNPDGPGFPDGSGFYKWSQYGTTAFNNGSEPIPDYINQWAAAGGNAFSILIPWSHYMSGPNQFRNTLVYENQRSRIRALNKKYVARFNHGRNDVNTDGIINPQNVALFQDGTPAYNGGGYVLRLDLLKAYIAGGQSDTTNPWHEAKRYVLKLVNDFKQDIVDGVCLGLSFTLNIRQEDGLTTEQGPNGTLMLADYSPGAIADFKATMSVTPNPPMPGAYHGRHAFAGVGGVKWYIYRELMYLMYKNWVRGLINSVVPNCPTGEDYGIIDGDAGANLGIANVPKISAGSGLVKINPDWFEAAEFAADQIRSLAPVGAHLGIELDTNWVTEGFHTANPTHRNVNEVAQKCGVYLSRGAGSLWFGQMGRQDVFNQAKLVLARCLELNQAGPITTIARPAVARRTSYSMSEALSADQNIAYQRWDGAGGFTAPVELTITDNLPYPV